MGNGGPQPWSREAENCCVEVAYRVKNAARVREAQKAWGEHQVLAQGDWIGRTRDAQPPLQGQNYQPRHLTNGGRGNSQT